MKKKYVCIIIFIIFCVYIGYIQYNRIMDIQSENDKDTIKSVDMLSMMLETEAGSGNYEMATVSSWPTEGYIFNATLSKCENGGELSWDDTNKQVLMIGTSLDKCYVYFDKYVLPIIKEVNVSSGVNFITINIVTDKSSGVINQYFFSKNNGSSYSSSTVSSYTFSGLSVGTYNIKVYVKDSDGYSSEIISKIVSINNPTLKDYIKSLYTGVQGENGIYYHNSELSNGASDNSYRYAGANPNNYICYGSIASSCPDDNLYRIIGVFDDEVKIIKATYATSEMLGTDYGYYSDSLYMWDSNNNFNNWTKCELNNKNLNKNFEEYILSLGTIWKSRVSKHTFPAGEVRRDDFGKYTPSELFGYEMNTTYGSDITYFGLMYMTDFLFAALPSAWSSLINNYYNSSISNSNWLSIGLNEWTVTYAINYAEGYYVTSNGGISWHTPTTGHYYVRPVFYLISSVNYSSGVGTKANPYRIS